MPAGGQLLGDGCYAWLRPSIPLWGHLIRCLVVQHARAGNEAPVKLAAGWSRGQRNRMPDLGCEDETL